MSDKISILVVDDEKCIRRVLEYRLESEGFKVYSAFDGTSGLKMAVDKRPDVILLDWLMPGMNGMEVLSELRRDERTKDIIVFMLTAKNLMDDVEAALANGANDYIIKPFEGDELGKRIMSMFKAVHMLHEESVS